MKAKETSLLQFMQGPKQFRIPIFQRTYSWEVKHCRQLWQDLLTALEEDRPAHFIGSIVYIEEGLYHVSSIPCLLVIDGQQRLTTTSLLLIALASHLDPTGQQREGIAAEIRDYYLCNPHGQGDLKYKLLLTQADRETLIRLVDRKDPKEDASRRLLNNYRFFEDQIARSGREPDELYRALARLFVVDVALDRQHDNPQLIFESMNSTGLDLSQADLIRNYVLMGQEPEMQEELYREHWFPMEQLFGQEDYGKHFDRFMRDFLTVKTGRIPNIRDVYVGFKEYAPTTALGSIETILADVHRFARYFVNMAFEKEADPDLRSRFAQINALRVDVAYPFLLKLYADHADGTLDKPTWLEILDLVESYVFRRMICRVPTNALSKIFASLAGEVDPNAFHESVLAGLLLRKHNQRFPRDDEFRTMLTTEDIYNIRANHYLLSRLENFERKEPVPTQEYTIEHVLPQTEALSAEWRTMLGPDWVQTQKTLLHTLGNLTLTGYNSEYSDRPFTEKQNMKGGFCESPLKLNVDLRTATTWDAAAIQARAARLADIAEKVWPCPSLPVETLATYKARQEGGSEYTLEDHPSLSGPTGELFDTLRAYVLQLGPSVNEEVGGLYITYSLTNAFLCVVPWQGGLTLYLDTPLGALRDPRKVAVDMSGTAHWGSGDTRIYVHDAQELEYALDLVEQAYDYQFQPEPSVAKQ